MRQMAEGAKAINQTLAGTNKRMTKMEYEVKESRMEAKVARDENQSNKWTLLHVTTTDSQITRKVSELNSNIALDNWNLLHMRTTSLHFTSLHFTSLHFTSLHFTSLHFTSLHFTSHPISVDPIWHTSKEARLQTHQRSSPARQSRCEQYHRPKSPTRLSRSRANQRDKVWDCEGYTVNYEPPQNILYPNNPATIATTNISSVDPAGLIAELRGFVDEYIEQYAGGFEEEPALLDDHRVDFGKFFVVSCSTVELAHYICSKFPVVGTPYELVYELNDRGLVTADRARDNDKKYRDDMHDARESSAQAAYQMVKDQGNLMKKLSDRMDQTERQRNLDRREDAETNATMFCMTQESSDILMKQVAADQEIRNVRESRDKFEAELRTIEETIDDYEGDETPKGKKKYNRALSQRERVDQRVAEEISSLRKAVLAREELRNFKSPWKQRLMDRLGNTIQQLTDSGSSSQAIAPSTTLAIQALEHDDQVDSHGPTKKTKLSEAGDSTGKEAAEGLKRPTRPNSTKQ